MNENSPSWPALCGLRICFNCHVIGRLLFVLVAMTAGGAVAADITFNINYIAEANPFPPEAGSNFAYADVWSENGFVYVGSDRGIDNSSLRRGVSVFSLTNSGIPTFLPPPVSPPAGYAATTYFGSEMEDVEVYDGIGYFSSDINGSTGRTGVDIVDLSIPFDPIMLSRVDTSDCLAGNPGVCAHGKVHTIALQRFNENTPSEQRFLYTSDNATTTIKITDVTDPSNPQLIQSLSLGLASNIDSHEVVVRDNRLFVASKNPSSSTTDGWVHIYDVANPANPILLKGFLSGAATHTAMPTYDGKTLIVAEERSNGNIKIYDISMIDQPNDLQNPVLLTTLNRTSVGIDAHSPHHVHVHGNLMFLPWYEAGLQVFNISDPANPVHVGAFDTYPGTSTNFNGNWGVDLSHGLKRVLLSDRKRGLIVVDASGVVAPGDYNQDMIVDADDYAEWRSTFATTRVSVHDAPLADGNGNVEVDAADYVIWRKYLGTTGPGGNSLHWNAAAPEPGTFLMLVLGISLVSAGRRRSA